MATQVQFRRGSTSEHSSFTGAIGEVTVDTDLDTIRVHDGSTAGGIRIAKFSEVNSAFTLSDASSNTISVTPGDSDITIKGDGSGVTPTVAGNSVTFALDNVVNLTSISSSDSTGVTINDDLLITGVIKAEGSSAIFIDDGLSVSGAITSSTTISGTTVTGTTLTLASGFSATQSSGDVTVANATSNKDLIFTVNDGGAATEVFRLDGDVSALLIASGKELRFADSGEKIASDGTDLTISSGAKITLAATSDVFIPVDIGLAFGDGGEKIETDNTDLTITSGGKLNLSPNTDVHIPANKGLVFGAGEKIEGDDTNLTITSGGTIVASCTSLVTTVLDVNIIQSTDSAEILVNEALRVSGTITGTVTAAQYADLAEKYTADAEYSPGTVMVFGGDNEITQSTSTHDAKIAGIISTDPAFIMNNDLENSVLLGLTGRVPCKVKGPIAKGDMVTSSNIPGVACRLNTAQYTLGCVLGKALEDYDSNTEGVIEVVVGRL